MNGFHEYLEEVIRDSKAKGRAKGMAKGLAEGIAEGIAESRISGAKIMAARLRKLHLSDSEILQCLREDYGSNFTEEQLLGFVNATK